MSGKDSPNNKKKALGLGIKALLNNIDNELKETQSNLPGNNNDKSIAQVGGRIPLDLIDVNPQQPRKDFDDKSLKELAESIKIHDIIQPITVSRLPNGRFKLISGERRFRASQLAGLKSIPAFIRMADSSEILEMALIENLQRVDLNPIEIALSYRQLMDECQITQEELAHKMSKERSTVANYLRLLKLPPDIQKAVRDQEISMGHARSLLSLENVDEQLYVFREIKEKNLSVRQVEQLVKKMNAESEKGTEVKKAETSSLPHAYKRIQDDLSSHFATKTILDRKKNGKGKIVIEFYSDQDLERILEAMKL